MQILAFNGSPRKHGNTSTIIRSMIEGVRSRGAQTTEVRLHDIGMKGCMGCLGCRDNPGFCSQRDGLTDHLEAVKTCDGIIVGCPIYMYRIAGQMKLFVDRLYSLYASRPDGGYDSMVPPGKSYALVVSQGAPDPNQYERSIRWLAGMTGSGLGMIPAGQVIHTDSHENPARDNAPLLEEAFRIGQNLVR